MVMLVFVIDLPRLSSNAIKDTKQFLSDLAEGFEECRLFESSLDRLALLYITSDQDKDKVDINVAYQVAESRNFNLDRFNHAVKCLPMVESEMGLEIDFESLVNDMPLLHMGDQFVNRQVVFLTTTAPDLTAHCLKTWKNNCVSFKFLHPTRISEYIPRQKLVGDFVRTLLDDRGDLCNILVPLKIDCLELDHIVQAFENQENDVGAIIVSVSKVISDQAHRHLEDFPFRPLLRWYPATMAEIHGISVNGFKFDIRERKRPTTLLSVLSYVRSRQDLGLHVVACRCKEDEQSVAAMYVVTCSFS